MYRRERAIDDPELIFDAEAQKEEEEEEVTSRKLPTHFIQPSDSERWGSHDSQVTCHVMCG